MGEYTPLTYLWMFFVILHFFLVVLSKIVLLASLLSQIVHTHYSLWREACLQYLSRSLCLLRHQWSWALLSFGPAWCILMSYFKLLLRSETVCLPTETQLMELCAMMQLIKLVSIQNATKYSSLFILLWICNLYYIASQLLLHCFLVCVK